jgi:hypothetical protein
MSSPRNREEVINTQLAVLISRMGVEADAETIHVQGKHRPDVLFRMHGLRVVIEGKFADHPGAEELVLKDARNRVRAGIAHIAMAAIYPKPLRTTPTAKIIERLEKSQIKYRIISEAYESKEWFEGDPASLMDALRRVHEALTKDDVVEQTAKSLSIQLEAVAELWSGQTGACDRLSGILGIALPKKEESEKAHERRETAAKVSALVLANAFIFQEQLAHTDGRVTGLRKLDKSDDVVSAAGKHWKWIWENINYVPNFSENTDLSEVLFIARKLSSGEKLGPTTYINLWRNPRTIHEAIDLANRIEHLADQAVSVEGAGVTGIRGLSGKLGEIVTTPAPRERENWTGALFSQTELLRAWFLLHRGNIRIPGDDTDYPVSVCDLGSLGELGYDRRDIHDAFEPAPGDWTPYAAFWGHDASKVRTIAQESNNSLAARTTAPAGRKLKSAQAVWSKAGPILLAERIRFNTHRCIALGFNAPVLGNTWWSFRTEKLSKEATKALLLWLNSSLAILLYYSRRVVTEGAFVGMKKPAWSSMPVLDVGKLRKAQLDMLAKAYDELAGQELDPLAQLDQDKTRGRIDSALCRALGFPDLSPIRELLAREPGLSARDINSDDHEANED